jgi:hypothetical protein
MMDIEVYNRNTFYIGSVHMHGISSSYGYVVEQTETMTVWSTLLAHHHSLGSTVVAGRSDGTECIFHIT